MADLLKEARATAEEAREALTDAKRYKELDRVGRLLGDFRELEGKVRHADQGYSGISPAIRIEEPELNRLYEYDASLLDGASALGTEADALKEDAASGEAVAKRLSGMRSLLDEFEETFRKRLRVITDTEVDG